MPTFGLCIIDTDSYKLANNAVNISVKRFRFDKKYILTDRPELFSDAASAIRIKKIRKIEDYNELVLKFLPDVVDVDYILIIQFDGYIINQREWANLFLHYDYIGAPWSDKFPDFRVGNGGFSLRSRKIIQACRDLPYDPSVPEDLFLSRYSRAYLEMEKSVRFAPVDVASHFSVEDVPVPYPTFGFHSLRYLPGLYRDNLDYLIENLPVRAFKDYLLRREITRLGPEAVELMKKRLNPPS